MNKRIIFLLATLGWLMLFLGLFMGSIRHVGYDPGLYHRLQTQADVLAYAGISDADLLHLDVNLANYLFGKYESPNLEIEVFGQMQPAFNEKELIHLQDCRKLLAPTVNVPLNVILGLGGALLLIPGERKLRGRSHVRAMWTASAIVILPIALLGFWAAVDFNSAFNFFHKILFTNDLWLLNPYTDLLIRICPSSMFANMGLRIGLMTAAVLIGIPAAVTVLQHLSQRKRKSNETDL